MGYAGPRNGSRPEAPDTGAEVIVVGAGPAGSTAALLLARAGRRVVLIDRDAFPRDKVCGDLIGTYAIALLRRLEIDLAIVRATAPLRGAYVYAPHGRSIGGHVGESRAARLGARVIPRVAFDAALAEAAVEAGAVFRRARVTAIERDVAGSIIGVRTEQGTRIHAPVTIGADGWGSIVARAFMRRPRRADEVAIAARVYLENVVPFAAMRFFVGNTGDGYGWIFPLPDGGANAGLGFIRSEARTADVHAAFARFLERPELRGSREVGVRRAWPIPLGPNGGAVSTAGGLLAGDAASLASALSGSGIHTAIASGALAARTAISALARGDVSAAGLRAYDRSLNAIVARLRFERQIHRIAGTPAASSRAVDIARHVPGVGQLSVSWLLNLG